MKHTAISIATSDGLCPATLLCPGDAGSWPAIIFYMDGFGIRPTMLDMAARLARLGYAVLLPDMYYRFGPYAPLDPKIIYAGDRQALLAPYRVTIDLDKATRDTRALLDFLVGAECVRGRQVGVLGFCMGGGFALAAAGHFTERVIAADSYHGGNLATDEANSPHRLAASMRAEIYVAGAEHDRSYPQAMAKRLEEAFVDAGTRYRCDTYPGTQHSWMVPDIPAYNHAAAERGWREIAAFFQRTLQGHHDDHA